MDIETRNSHKKVAIINNLLALKYLFLINEPAEVSYSSVFETIFTEINHFLSPMAEADEHLDRSKMNSRR